MFPVSLSLLVCDADGTDDPPVSLLPHSQQKTREKLGSLRERTLLVTWERSLSPPEPVRKSGKLFVYQAADVVASDTAVVCPNRRCFE